MPYIVFDKKKNKRVFEEDTYSTEKKAKIDILYTISGAMQTSDMNRAIYYLDNYAVRKIAPKKPTTKKKVVRKSKPTTKNK